ncbi:MAG: ATP-binding cassette domain-containing protein, partial [Lachnospiraceae bacterium]|nr:ATP-binding cassette domain-containing protein [Lachnospiraceae bacterium]
MSKHLIDLQNISKSFGNNLVLDELNLYIRENEFLTLLGPSGCGKTTTLRIIGGFETPDIGKVIFDGEDITEMSADKMCKAGMFLCYQNPYEVPGISLGSFIRNAYHAQTGAPVKL